MEIQKIVFWTGVGALIGGVVLFGYGSLTVQDLFEKYRELFMHPFEAFSWLSSPSPIQIIKEQLFLVQLLQLVGLGMAVLGAITLAYGLWVKKENK